MKEKALRSYIELKSAYVSAYKLAAKEMSCSSCSTSSCSGDSCDDGGGGE